MRPDHYTTGKIECIEAIKEQMTPEAFQGFLRGNVVKYIWRFDKKGTPVDDLEKAQDYLARLINEVRNESKN